MDNKRLTFLKNKTYQLAFKLGIVFIVTSVLGTILGNFLDNQFDIKPYGTLLSLGVFYVLTWIIIFRIYTQLRKETKEFTEDKEK